MDAIPINEAKTHLSRLIARAEAGEEIVVRRGATPVAKIVGVPRPDDPAPPGSAEGADRHRRRLRRDAC